MLDINIHLFVWDQSEGRCITCNSTREDKIWGTGTQLFVPFGTSGDYQCESACGANSRCDEVTPPASFSDICGTTTLEVSRYCNSVCAYSSTTYTCGTSACGQSQSCGGTTYSCVYSGGSWQWSTTEPSGFCCSNDDCGYDSTTKLKMDCNAYKRCETGPCGTDNSLCDTGYCCEGAVGGDESTCRRQGYIYNNNQLCDPPEWTSSSVDQYESNDQKTSSNLFTSIIEALLKILVKN